MRRPAAQLPVPVAIQSVWITELRQYSSTPQLVLDFGAIASKSPKYLCLRHVLLYWIEEAAVKSVTGRREMCMLRAMILAALATGLCAAPAYAAGTPAPANAEVYIVWPRDGTVIDGGKLWVRMGLKNMGVAPKGVNMPNVGHHHLLIDTELPPPGEQIPSDRNHLHFGAGETEARIELPPGKHTLQLLLGDHDHTPHDPPVFSKKITVIVR